MIKNLLAVIGVLAIIAGGAALAVFKPWENGIVVANGASAPAVYFDTLREEGIDIKRVSVTSKPSAVLYVSYSKFFNSPVLLRAFDRSGQEVGRAKRVLSGDSEDAGYADFEFDARVPMTSVTFFELTKSKIEPAPVEEVLQVEEVPAEPVPAETPNATPAPEAEPVVVPVGQ